LPIFAAAASLLVGQRCMKDILPPRALPLRQISGNAPVSYLRDGFEENLDRCVRTRGLGENATWLRPHRVKW